MRDRFYQVAAELLDSHDRAVMVAADIGVSAMPEHRRLINLGIREQLMIGVASGLALEGYRPIAHSYAPFLIERPWEQIKLDLGHQGVGAILVSVGASYDASSSGRTHQAPEDVALLSALPGWTIHVPGHADEMEQSLRRAMTSDHNVYIRLDQRSNRVSHPGEGSVKAIRQGSPGAPFVLAVGPMLDLVAEAMAGVDITLAYASTVRPLDGVAIRRLASNTSQLVMVEPYLEGTSHASLAAAVSDRAVRIASIGYRLEESRGYGTPQDHLAHHELDPVSLRGRLLRWAGLSEDVSRSA